MSTDDTELVALVEQLAKLALAHQMTCLEVHRGDLKVELHFKPPTPPEPAKPG